MPLCRRVSQPFAPAWHTKSGSFWSSIIFQPLHDLKSSLVLLKKLPSQKYSSVPYGEILGPCIILHRASVLALWPVPGGAAPVLWRSFEYQQRRSSSWGLEEGIDHVWWISACVVQEGWWVNGWKMWELALSSLVAVCSSSLMRGSSCPGSVGDVKDGERWADGCWWHLVLGTQPGSSLGAVPWLAIGF